MFFLQFFSRILTPLAPWSISRWSCPVLRCPVHLGLWGLLCCLPRSLHCRLSLWSHKFCNLSLALFKSSHWLLMFKSLPSRRFFGCCLLSQCLPCLLCYPPRRILCILMNSNNEPLSRSDSEISHMPGLICVNCAILYTKEKCNHKKQIV